MLSGGGGLDALQTASIIAALPFAIIMILMIISILILLRRDWIKNYRPFQVKRRTLRKKNISLKEQPALKGIYEEIADEIYLKVKDDIYNDLKKDLMEDINKEP